MSKQERKTEETLEEDRKMEIIGSTRFLNLIEITEERKCQQETDGTTEKSKEGKMDKSPTEDKTEKQDTGNEANSSQVIGKQLEYEKERKTRDNTSDRREKRQKSLRRNLERKKCVTCKDKNETNQKEERKCDKCYGWIWMEIIGKKLAEIEYKKDNKEGGKNREIEIEKAMSALDGAIEKLKKSR